MKELFAPQQGFFSIASSKGLSHGPLKGLHIFFPAFIEVSPRLGLNFKSTINKLGIAK